MKIKKAAPGTLTFAEQAVKFMQNGISRKRSPFRPQTAASYQSAINSHLNPSIGHLALEHVGNAVVKDLVTELAAKGLAASSITIYINLIKQIRASAKNQDAEQLYPYTWDNEFMDVPVIEGQKQPTISTQKLEETLSRVNPYSQALYALLAGTGLRIAEALALRVGSDDGISTIWFPNESKIVVRQQRDGETFGPVKTKSGNREIDLDPVLNAFLVRTFKAKCILIQRGEENLLFPASENGYRNDLIQDGILGGFHAFRRFRITYLDGVSVPAGLQRFWTGHAAGDVHETYVKSGEKIQERKEWAVKAGLGFKLEAV
jgi:integrase